MESCRECYRIDEHEPWCSLGDTGQRPSAAIIWERQEEINDRISKLAAALGLPEDWDQ